MVPEQKFDLSDQGLSRIREAIFHLQPLDEEEWAALAGGFVHQSFQKGEFLIRQGQVENYIYFLERGAVRNWFVREGKEYTVDYDITGRKGSAG